MKPIRILSLVIVTGLFAACASAPPVDQKTASEPAAAKECVKSTGSNICRAPGTGNMNTVESISGEDLRRSGGPITGATPGKVGN